MKKNDNINNPSCPAPEQLSVFFDNPDEIPADMTVHIKNCSACQRVLADFRLLDLALKHHSTTKHPANLAANITSAVNLKLQRQKTIKHFINPGMILKIAASFAFISFAVFHSINIFRSPAPPQTIAKSYQTKIVKPAINDQNRFNPYYDNSRNAIMPGVIHENSIPLDNIIGANYGGHREPVFQVNNLPSDHHKSVIIPQSVHQVWVADNPAKAALTMTHALTELKISPFNSNIIENNGNFSGNAKLTKIQLVKLVRICKNAGLDLLSPQAPQPEDNKFRGKPDTQINYDFDIVSPN